MRLTSKLLCVAATVMATGCAPVRHNLPPEQRMMEPGPGVGGPGPGVLDAPAYAPNLMGGGMGMGMDPGMMMPSAPPTVQVTFARPESMMIRYNATGSGQFDSEPLVAPARLNFPQGGLFRLKVTDVVGREGVELYPTLELALATPRTGAYLAHNSIPVQFTEEDFDQVLTGNFVTKVIYLPDPEFAGAALAGIDTLVSTRLEPGVDPIEEADRRGSILAIIRIGDKDIEMLGMGGEPGMFAGGYGMGTGTGMPVPFAPCSEVCGGGNMPGIVGGPAGAPPNLPGMISGMTAPQYGMPHSGTPIGLPGPPHIPLGAPAGLQKHVMRNHTPMMMPRPTKDIRIGVRQSPGFSYPQPASRAHITEQNIHPGVPYGRPHQEKLSNPVH
ncbi:hypothetical protein SH139x_000498 [Planctomycetaceae bacterium SH139]